MNGFVYLWTNRVNGKKYIGRHFGTPDDGYVGSGVAFLKAIEKYGIENFDRIILEETDDPIGRERYYLLLHDAANKKDFYNMTPYSEGGGHYGKKHKEEVKKQIAQTSKESAKIRAYNKSRPVVQLNLDGSVVARFDSLADAAKSMGAKNCSNIKYTCDGRWKTMYGYKWKYD